MEAKLKHLEFIQNVIDRLSHASFLYKGWMITILTALLGGFMTLKNPFLILIGVAPIIAFWALDALHLAKERQYRELFQKVANDEISDFKMITAKTDFAAFIQSLFSSTLILLYFSFLLLTLSIFTFSDCII